MNLATAENDEDVASTHIEVATQRAMNLATMGVKSVLELCVGPSYEVLANAYKNVGITCIGNDIDDRWRRKYPYWRHGDCLDISWDGVDAIVFAPPLSRNCSGRREDALLINDVQPSYGHFLVKWSQQLKYNEKRIAVMVLPARSLATPLDRSQLHWLIRRTSFCGPTELYQQMVGRRSIRKYVELYIKPMEVCGLDKG